MKISFHRGAGSARHNCRSFEIEKAEHIDPTKEGQNLYFDLTTRSGGKSDFVASEKNFYDVTFSDALNAMNKRYITGGHPERVKEMKDWIQTDEEIIQLGNKNEQIDTAYLTEVLQGYISDMQKKYPNWIPLNLAIHLDEATPHVHLRSVIVAHDKDGYLKPAKNRGLKEMGIERPDISKPEGRYNSPLMTFTADAREILYRKAEELGLEVDREVKPESQHLTVLEYKQAQEAQKLRDIEAERATLEADYQQKTEDLEEKYETYRAKLNNDLKQKKLEIKGFSADVLKAENQSLRSENQKLKAVLKENNLIMTHGPKIKF